MFTYNHKGETWGVTEINTEGKPYDRWATGWIPMAELLLVYDYISFADEHQDELYTYSGRYETLKTANTNVLWSWPGSGETQGILEALTDKDFEVFNISNAYKDEQGREWGFIGYWHGHRNVWICMSDPTNRDILAFNPPPQPKLLQPDDIPASESRLSTPLLIIILVTVLIVSTATLIRIFWKPNKG